jgi:hypothetical protein
MNIGHRSPFVQAGIALVALASPLVAGCSGEPAPDTTAPPEAVAEARQAYTLHFGGHVQRGSGGTVADAQLVRRTGTAIATDPDANANFGALPTATVGNGAGKKQYKSLLRFDLSFIPPGATVSSASVVLNTVSNGAGTVRAKRVTAPWSESLVTFRSWNNAQASNDEASFLAGPDDGGIGVLNLTALTQSWVNGTYANNGIVLLEESATASFATGESADEWLRPALDVAYTTPNYCATSSCADGSECINTPTGHSCACFNGLSGPNCDVPRAACPCTGLFSSFAEGGMQSFEDCSYTATSAHAISTVFDGYEFGTFYDPVSGTGQCSVVNQLILDESHLDITAAEAEVCRQMIIGFAKRSLGFGACLDFF